MDGYAQYQADFEDLAAIGREILAQPGSVATSLPIELADAAVRAWHRPDRPPLPARESPEQFRLRNRAGSLALLGLAIESIGYSVQNRMTVVLTEDLRSEAIRAAREAPTPPPR